jgi:hypothetical protein
MKKPFYALMIAILIMNISCEKDPNEPDPDESIIPTEIKTAADLNGTWEFVNLTYTGGGDFKECDEMYRFVIPNAKYQLLSFTFNASTGKATVTDKCNGVYIDNKDYELINGKIEIEVDDASTLIYIINKYEFPILELQRQDSTPIFLTVRKI